MKYVVNVTPMAKPRNWMVTHECFYENISVPAGFIFDGASIPLGFRGFLPHGGAKFFGACVHDYCYRTACLTKAEADSLFLEAMLGNGVKPWKAKAMYYAVKYFGWSSWNQRRKEQQDREELL